MTEPAYDVVNAQIGYAFGPDEQFRFRIWGRNLTDEVYHTYAIESALGNAGSPSPPMTYGAAFDFKF